MKTFKNNEAGYSQWHSAHDNAFVFNHFGGTNPNFNVLHRSTCSFLWRDKDENARTAVEKWCSTSEDELVQHANAALGNGMWKKCGVCFCSSQTKPPQRSAPAAGPAVPSNAKGSVWIPGEPAVWIGAGEKEWKQKVTSALQECVPKEAPQWLDIDLRLHDERIYRKDLDNMVTPILESARDAGWVERGFQFLGSVTARKSAVSNVADVGALITPHTVPPEFAQDRLGVLIETDLNGLDEKAVKDRLYDRAFELYSNRPELRFPPLCPVVMDIRVIIKDDNRRKSIQALMKPCIDGVEPILGHPDNLTPAPRELLTRRLAPQDEMVLSMTFHVRGGTTNGVSVLIRPHQEPSHSGELRS